MAQNKIKAPRSGSAFPTDIRPPGGNNSLNSLGLFHQRKYYRDSVYPTFTPTPLDLWYERKYFGKINTKGDAISAQKKFLKQALSRNPNVYALDFVVDAFNDFRNRFLLLNRNDLDGTPFKTLEPMRGWQSIEVVYKEYMSKMYERFAVFYMSKQKRDQKLLTFDIFMKMFLDFVVANAPHFPITLSQYIYSPLSSPTISGLMLELSLDAHGNDKLKYENFIKHPAFACYAEAAKDHGFKIDKNAPQRLIADINSPAMAKYMKVYPKAPKPFLKQEPKVKAPKPPPRPESPGPANPFEAGDVVEFVVMMPLDNPIISGLQVPYIILKDHTDLSKRGWFDMGQKAKLVNESVRVVGGPLGYTYKETEVNLLKWLIDHHKKQYGQMTPVIYKAKIVDPAPTDRLNNLQGNRGYEPADPASDPVAIVAVQSATRLGSNFERKEVIWNVQTGASLFTQTYIGANYKSVKDGQPLIGSRNYVSRPERTATEEVALVEVPLDAIHLAPSSTTITKERFRKRISYNGKLKEWQTQNSAYVKEWNDVIKPKMEEELSVYNAELKAYEAAVKYFEKMPRLSAANVIDLRQQPAYFRDMFILKEFCLQFYNSYATGKPRTTISEVIKCGDDFITKKTIKMREQIHRAGIHSKYSDAYWMKQYILFRNAELGNKKSLENMSMIFKESSSLKTRYNLKKALSYINDEFKFKVDNS